TGAVALRWNLFYNYASPYPNDYGAQGSDIPTGVAVGPLPTDVYVTGYTSSTDIMTTPTAYEPNPAAGPGEQTLPTEAFVTKIDFNAPEPGDVADFDYSTYLGGNHADQANGIAVDAGDNAYVTGTSGAGFPTTPGAYQQQSNAPHGKGAAIVAKLN